MFWLEKSLLQFDVTQISVYFYSVQTKQGIENLVLAMRQSPWTLKSFSLNKKILLNAWKGFHLCSEDDKSNLQRKKKSHLGTFIHEIAISGGLEREILFDGFNGRGRNNVLLFIYFVDTCLCVKRKSGLQIYWHSFDSWQNQNLQNKRWNICKMVQEFFFSY